MDFPRSSSTTLASWTRTAAAELDALLKLLVRISKQANVANVVFASSENFKEWLDSIRGHKIVQLNVGHLNEEEVKEFVRLKLWDDIYAHCGGAILLLRQLLRVALRSQPGQVCKNGEVVKRDYMANARSFVVEEKLLDGIACDLLRPLETFSNSWSGRSKSLDKVGRNAQFQTAWLIPRMFTSFDDSSQVSWNKFRFEIEFARSRTFN
ncbi:hypothetical protein SELMODRAFT_413296 [Selaginella moellendorffii]|uniref:Uncharacterized protein n=1 Tax=Selaginella moellendorffii TaxID=88036 RepID=D8RP01_SELML|nr:hypothetical protein SELMODRAFT_413296 [Selaginella moellendorffii]